MKLMFEMAYSRMDAIDRCEALGKQFLNHFNKIYNDPINESREHWETEMYNWWNQVKNIVLKQNNRKLSISNLHDWFFSAGQDPIDFFTSENKFDEEDCYDQLYLNLLQNRDITVGEALSTLL